VDVYRRFTAACYFHHQVSAITESTSETSVEFYQTAWRHTTEDGHLYACRCDNPISRKHIDFVWFLWLQWVSASGNLIVANKI
jgi:hypothetical protein